MNTFGAFSLIISILFQTGGVSCHGRLWEPPSRSSMWRRGYNTSVNINDNELNCGGFQNQWISYGGLCGTCGDPYQQNPRENEAGGKYASGIISRIYRSEETITITIDMTANHGGHFEFRLCPVEKRWPHATQECFDKYPLVIINQEKPGLKYWIQDTGRQGFMDIRAKLPPGLICKHCVMQWRWWTASRWGCDADKCGNGQGPQEEFYGCSDIAISPPGHYESYKRLVTQPTKSSPVVYGILSGPKANHDHIQSHQEPFQVVLSEFTETVREPKLLRRSLKQKSGRPKPKVFFKSGEVSTNPAIKDNLADAVQRITVDTILNYHKQDGNLRENNGGASLARCYPTARFANNPIIHEWCSRGCPGLSRKCPQHLCSCKSRYNNEVLIPYGDLVHYKSDLINKVPLELTNTFSNSKMYDAFYDFNSKHSMKGYHGMLRPNYPKVDMLRDPLRNRHEIGNDWKLVPHTEGRFPSERIARIPVKAQSIFRPKIFKLPAPLRALSGTRDMWHQTGKSDTDINSKRLLPLQPWNKFFTKMPVVKGLTFFTNRKPAIHAKPLMFSHDIVPKTFASPPLLEGITPFELTATRLEIPNSQLPLAPREIRCSASTIFGHVNSMSKWCQKNCSFGFCPPSVCKCF